MGVAFDICSDMDAGEYFHDPVKVYQILTGLLLLRAVDQ